MDFWDICLVREVVNGCNILKLFIERERERERERGRDGFLPKYMDIIQVRLRQIIVWSVLIWQCAYVTSQSLTGSECADKSKVKVIINFVYRDVCFCLCQKLGHWGISLLTINECFKILKILINLMLQVLQCTWCDKNSSLEKNTIIKPKWTGQNHWQLHVTVSIHVYEWEYQSKFKLTTNGYINYNQVGLKLHCGFNIKRHDIKRAPRYTS